ncbi:MAG: molybdenum cofactor guanylyltransferase [Pyrinomonadaceae bacterium]
MNVDPYILIGGASRRFGPDKATFKFEGEMLATRAARIAETALVGSTATFVAADVEQFVSLDTRQTITDSLPGLGAVGAVSTALSHASAEWTFILACDLPFVTPEFIRFLASFANDEWDAIVPVQKDGRWQPLCGFYRPDNCRDTFQKAVEDRYNVPSLRSSIESLSTRIVTFPEYSTVEDAEYLLQNVNEPSDLTRRP